MFWTKRGILLLFEQMGHFYYFLNKWDFWTNGHFEQMDLEQMDFEIVFFLELVS